MKRILTVIAGLLLVSAPAHAKYDYVRDILLGNTVEIHDLIGGHKSRYFFRADNSVVRLIPGVPDETGTWRQTRKKLCSTFPSDGQEVCSDKPKNATVPGSITLKGKIPGGERFHVVFTWMLGEVRFE